MSNWESRISGDGTTRPKDHRDPFQRDKARILHSSAFRRLQSKTQVLSVGQHDFYRTRLTHSLEVAQIGTGLLAQLEQNEQVQANPELQAIIPAAPLMEALCLAHDLGHPPFGHGGEVALNYMMRNDGGFEGNGQTFRIITQLEPYTEHFGMDLTKRTCLGLLKYPAVNKITQSAEQTDTSYMIKAKDWKPTKAIYQDDLEALNWVLSELTAQEKAEFTKVINGKTQYKSLDASIMELADDIAYGVHDLEDAIVLQLVTREQWFEQALPELQSVDNLWSKKYSKQLSSMLFSQKHFERKNAIGALVNHLVTNIEVHVASESFTTPLIKYQAKLSASAQPLLDVLKRFVYHNLIMNPQIQQLEFRGQRMLIAMFDAFSTDPDRLLPLNVQANLTAHSGTNRVICDYLASMSDQQAIKTYRTMFSDTSI